ncbi:MAG: D-amino acid aminotransferase [Betaproteobacteria bacterium]|nr:D-amino acid aminotransferase [Betaproteobacteria bacterium]MDE2004626.1 D-amino acid aminotransferase [Betaproteobacteria bacterium]
MPDASPPVYLNGEFMPIADARIPVLDRGFIFGDGVYEVVPVYARQPYRMPQHLARLQHSLDGIRLPNPHPIATWEALVAELIARQSFADQAVYMQVTRGVARRDHAFPQGVAPTVFMMSNPLVLPTPVQVERGVDVITAQDNRWLRCDLKTTSLLGNVLMRQLAVDHGAVETVLFRDGHLTEASASNVLIVHNGAIVAPPKDHQILPGITYDATLELARDIGIQVDVRPVTHAEVLAADEVWLSSSSKEVLAVTRIDGRPVGGGTPGPLFRKMWKAFQERKPRAA